MHGDRTLTDFERKVLELILDGTNSDATTLQQQLAVAEVSGRSPDGRGVWFEIPDYAERLPDARSTTLSNLGGTVVGRDGGTCDPLFLLHIRRGEITMLEVIGAHRLPPDPQLRSWYYAKRGRDGLIL